MHQKDIERELEKSPAGLRVKEDPRALAFTLNMFTATLKIASGKPGDVAFGSLAKITSTADMVGSKNVQLASSSSQILIQSFSLIQLTSKTHPGAVLATVGAVTVKKVSLALALADDDVEAKCMAAWTDLASNLLTTGLAVAAVPGTGGLATTVAVASVANLILSAKKVYDQYE